jgi:hypothetical protein
MISSRMIKVFKMLFDNSILDNTEKESDIEEYLENTFWDKVADYYYENIHTNPDTIGFPDDEFSGLYESCPHSAWLILPNINVINEAYKKWNETPLFVGKKWIVSHLCEDLKVFSDLDSYNIDLGYFKNNNKTYQYYKDIFGDSTLKEEEYENYDKGLCDPTYIENKDEDTKDLSEILTYDLLDEIKYRVNNSETDKEIIINFIKEYICKDCE